MVVGSIKEEYPYYSFLMALSNDQEMSSESDSELDCKYEFNTPTVSSAAPSVYESDVVTPEIRYGAATLRPAGKRLPGKWPPGKRPPGSGGVTVDDQVTFVEGSEEGVEYRSNCEDEGYEDNEGREDDSEDEEIHRAQEEIEYRSNYEDGSNKDNESHDDTEDEEIYEAQEEVQDEIHDQMDTDEEFQEELESTHSGNVSRESHDEHIVINDSSEIAPSPSQPNRGSSTPEAATFAPSVSTCTVSVYPPPWSSKIPL